MRVDPRELLEVAGERRAVGADESDAVAAIRLLDRGPRVREQRGGVGDDALLDRGLEPAGERKTADRQHGIAELQQARQMHRQ